MNYKEVNWKRINERYSSWWKGELETPIFYIVSPPAPGKEIELEPRPEEPSAVKKWFMDPVCRMTREVANVKNRQYFADAFPSVDIGRINIGQAAFYGCPTNFTHHTIWVDHVLDDWNNWEEKFHFDDQNEIWQLTVAQAHKAMEMVNGEMAITMLGGFEGPLDNLSTARGVENALMDILDRKEEVLALERQFLKDFKNYYFSLYDIIKDNPKGVSLWSGIPMTDGPAHCMQSDFSCMISPDQFKEMGLWYLEEQAEMFSNVMYHLDGSNALHHLPTLLSLDKLDCVQFVWQVPEAKRLVEWVHIFRQILESGKRAEVHVCNMDDVIPFLKQVPAKGLKMNIYPPSLEAAESIIKEIKKLGYPVD